jgi:hypothetical protein
LQLILLLLKGRAIDRWVPWLGCKANLTFNITRSFQTKDIRLRAVLLLRSYLRRLCTRTRAESTVAIAPTAKAFIAVPLR